MRHERCRICAQPIRPFMSLGRQPIGNAFLKSPADFATEYFFELAPAHCAHCATFQIVEIPAPEQMFHDHYAYFATTASTVMTAHFARMAEEATARFLAGPDPFVVEIGSNDGITLRNFAQKGIRHLGVEPSANVAQAARANGVATLTAFFNPETARAIRTQHGPADLFIATNTMHHIEDTNGVAEGVATLLGPKGVMISEDPYLGDMIEIGAYDQIYAEHMYIWSITAMNNAFGRAGLEVFDVARNRHHGGCMRYHLGRKGVHAPTDAYRQALAHENALGLHRPETFERFRADCERARTRLTELVRDLRAKGKRIAGYGATAKSATIVNWCGLTPDDIAYISDTTPAKQHSFAPGSHIPVVPPQRFAQDPPDYAVLFAWNHFAEIEAKEQAWRAKGGQWILPIKGVQVV
ncbi:MAG: class I SAM-dependent methyltransferase [Rhodospirillales bacterium]|nr:class I SAM-dependent methyltransferase [Rhodospirillales bacterium]